jgi:hypothetical protein
MLMCVYSHQLGQQLLEEERDKIFVIRVNRPVRLVSPSDSQVVTHTYQSIKRPIRSLKSVHLQTNT